MKMNKLVGLSLAMMLGFGVVGCGNMVELESTEVPQVEVEEEVQENNNFDKYNILSFENVEVDTTIEYSGDTFNDIKFKATNNSDKTIHSIFVDVALYDEEGVMLGVQCATEINSIQSGNSFYLETLYDTTEYENVAEVKIVSYQYNIEENYYEIDLVGQFAEVFEY